MALTDKEFKDLVFLQGRSLRPMSDRDYQMLDYLRNKYYLNKCLNPTCVGYCGTDEETSCPKCGGVLYKVKQTKI